MDEIQFIKKLKERGIDLNRNCSLAERALDFDRALKMIIKPKDVSDTITFRNLNKFLVDSCKTLKFEEHSIFRRVLDFALEASGPKSRNPAAVFMAIIKKELGYLKND